MALPPTASRSSSAPRNSSASASSSSAPGSSFEVGKNWAEADADVGETIDFLEFYAREALRLDAATTPIQYPGERNQLRYIPLGVGAVIPPWNFPFAIMAGMTAASIVCGNTVILKPSGDAPTIAARFFDLLEEAGLPDGVVNFCSRRGPEVGRADRRHPADPLHRLHRLQEAVGLEIHERAAKTQPGQLFIKRTILEMGGKDSIIVERRRRHRRRRRRRRRLAPSASTARSAPPAPAPSSKPPSTTPSASASQDRVAQLKTGDPAENVYAGPVINKAAYDQRPRATSKSASRRAAPRRRRRHAANDERRLLHAAHRLRRRRAHRTHLAQEEIFGPVLAVIKCQGLRRSPRRSPTTPSTASPAPSTPAPAKSSTAPREDFHVGNLYFNRKCTGAMVGAHPFGGFNMSGTDSKAGGPDYLLLFTQAKSIAEKKGFVSPDIEEQEQRMGI